MASSYGTTPVNALSMHSGHVVRSNNHGLIARAKRGEPAITSTRRRCKQRPSEVAAPVHNDNNFNPGSTQPAPEGQPAANNPQPTQDQQQPDQQQPAPQQPAPQQPAPQPNPPAQGGGNGNKVGIAWANPGSDDLLQYWVGGRSSAVYTWSSYKPPILNDYPWIEFIPMLWGPSHVDEFRQRVVAGYANTVLAFNEPDQQGQANIDVGYAVDLFRTHILPLASQGYRLGSPAPTNAPTGTAWLQDFMNRCQDCQISIVVAHWYGLDAQNFIDHVTNYHNLFQREVWVTEFACQNFGAPENGQCNPDQVWAFLRTVTQWMDNTAFVGKYFAFGALFDMNNVNYDNQLMGSDGRPNALGNAYINGF